MDRTCLDVDAMLLVTLMVSVILWIHKKCSMQNKLKFVYEVTGGNFGKSKREK
jgi:hypothetical protein